MLRCSRSARCISRVHGLGERLVFDRLTSSIWSGDVIASIVYASAAIVPDATGGVARHFPASVPAT